jgi:hypothetical protein
MRTEELLRYDTEYRAMQKALGTSLLVFAFPGEAFCLENQEQPTSKEVISGKNDPKSNCEGRLPNRPSPMIQVNGSPQ